MSRSGLSDAMESFDAERKLLLWLRVLSAKQLLPNLQAAVSDVPEVKLYNLLKIQTSGVYKCMSAVEKQDVSSFVHFLIFNME